LPFLIGSPAGNRGGRGGRPVADWRGGFGGGGVLAGGG